MLLATGEGGDFDRADTAQRSDNVLDKHLRSGCTRGQADALGAVHPLGLKLAAVRDQIARNALFRADLAQARLQRNSGSSINTSG